MANPALIAPDLRQLGWPLNDLTLYGAQPTDGVTVPGADDETVAPTAPPPGTGETAPEIAPTPLPFASAFAADASPLSAPLSGGNLFPAPQSAIAPAAFHPAAPDPAPSVPLPTGSGSIVTPPVATPLEAMPHAADAPAPAADPAVAALSVPVIAPLAPVDDHLHDALAPALTAAPVALGVIGGEAAGLEGAAASEVGQAHAALDATAADAAGLVTATAAAVAQATAPVTAAIGLDGLAGADPAAGIHTLVGMVESADQFDLTHVAATTEATAPTSIVDALAADEAPSPLIGDDGHHDVAGLGHLADDGGVHLGL